MSDIEEFGTADIANQERAFTVDDVLTAELPTRAERTTQTDSMENIESLVRTKHANVEALIEQLVNQRSDINATIKLARQDLAVLESAVNRYDRIRQEAQEEAEGTPAQPAMLDPDDFD